MTDIVERLRGHVCPDQFDNTPCDSLKHEAADEIERLQADQWGHDQCHKELLAAESEVKRLRGLLVEWDDLIQYQYTGSLEAMSALASIAQKTAAALSSC